MCVIALCGTVGLALALTGCGASDNAQPQAPSQAPSTPSLWASPADPDAAVKTAVLTSYTSMWVEQMKAYRKASPEGTRLKDFATLDALSVIERDLATMKKNGARVVGGIGHGPEVVALDMEAKIATATVEDCIDLSHWRAQRTSGEAIPLPSAQPKRFVATASMERWDNNRWMVTEYKPDQNQSC
ncbi:hypothetical protein [Streptomyces sp. NPDC060022]|uniref:hypothetical protein n=1 Tax=Streptomyces sp. NPDC060022 TaxID=3347039 RepID=UPI0036A0F7C0